MENPLSKIPFKVFYEGILSNIVVGYEDAYKGYLEYTKSDGSKYLIRFEKYYYTEIGANSLKLRSIIFEAPNQNKVEVGYIDSLEFYVFVLIVIDFTVKSICQDIKLVLSNKSFDRNLLNGTPHKQLNRYVMDFFHISIGKSVHIEPRYSRFGNKSIEALLHLKHRILQSIERDFKSGNLVCKDVHEFKLNDRFDINVIESELKSLLSVSYNVF